LTKVSLGLSPGKIMDNHHAGLKLLEKLGPDHPYLPTALAALGLVYVPPQDVFEIERKPPVVLSNPAFKVEGEAGVELEAELQPQAVDYSFPVTVVSRLTITESAQQNQPILTRMRQVEPLEPEQNSQLPQPPLVPLWQEKTLYQALMPYLYQLNTARQPDIDKIAHCFARKQPMIKWPLLVNRQAPAEIWLYCDFTHGGCVYHQDYQDVQRWLLKWFGINVVRQNIKLVQRGGVYHWLMQHGSHNALHPPAGTLALVVGHHWQRSIWQNLQRGFKTSGATAIYLAVGSLNPTFTQPTTRTKPLDKLLAALSLSPAVLTLAMIRQLHTALFNDGSTLEAKVATHEAIEWYQSNNRGFWAHSAEHFQNLAKTLLSADEQMLAFAIINRHLQADEPCWLHQHQMYTWLFCQDLSSGLKAQLEDNVNHYLDRFASRQLVQSQPHELEWLMIQARKLAKNIDKLPEKANQALTLTNLLWRQHSGSDEVLPGVDSALWQQWHQQEQIPAKPGSIIQLGDELRVVDQQDTEGAQIVALSDIHSLMVQPQSAWQAQGLITQVGGELTVTNQNESVVLKTFSSNDFYWANSLSITSDEVVATTDYVRVSWPANRFANHQGAVIEVMDDAPKWLKQHQPQLDQYGLFIILSIKEIELKLRYIPPGCFLMGSPEDEVGRDDDETLHPVTLTQGYWLAETTVSQQLWQAVMGKNPSEFKAKKHELLPVEKVSWDDCQLFCTKMNQIVAEMDLILPTEAQWEYACRAGTQTPFHTGEQLTQANFKGEKTVAIDHFKPNPWSLQQMHGNVYEWCQDGKRDYSPQAEIDPIGGLNSSDRVLRGGGWLSYGRGCRSAYRFWSHRGDAGSYVGLRVTQVEKAQERATPEAPIRSEAPQRSKDETRAVKGKASGDQNVVDRTSLATISHRHRWYQRPPQQFPSPWASEWGFDQYGLWQTFKVKDIRCKMRFITQGFWLAETTMTQQFRQRANQLIAGLALTLATEAQWAAACLEQDLPDNALDDKGLRLIQPDHPAE
jgi:sulfatase modifying factor 1